MNAIDDAYETLCLDWQPARIYDTTLRCWRWVLLAPWRIGAVATPADPDAALDEAAPLFQPQNTGRPSQTWPVLQALLRERAPLTMPDMAALSGLTYAAIKHYVGNHPGQFVKAGKQGGCLLYRLKEG